MLSEKDKQFIAYWEKERERLNNVTVKLVSGLPMAILFCVPILLFITAVYLFFPEWYTKVSNNMSGSMVAIIVALVICVFFFSYFRMHYKWEMNEQLYRELKQKQQQEVKISQ
jgi:succinate dehydrogenase hydrophobic anchor subunit